MSDVPLQRYAAAAELFVSAADVSRTLFDDEGRPLGERYFPAEFRGPAGFRMRRCPYDGSRYGRNMNVSALTAILGSWQDVLAMLTALRASYLDGLPAAAMTWAGLWFLGRIATALPAYLVRRAGSQVATIPVAISSLFKPSIGLYMAAERAFLYGEDPHTVPALPDVLALLETSGALLSSDAACPVPPRLLARFLAAALDGDEASQQGDLDEAAATVCSKHVVAYGRAVALLELGKFTYFIERERDLECLAGLGLLARDCRMPLTNLRDVPIGAGDLDRVHVRLQALTRSLGMVLPADEHSLTAQGSSRRVRLDLHDWSTGRAGEWLSALSKLQLAVLRKLGYESVERLPIELADLARIAAYQSMDWRYLRVINRYRISVCRC